MTFSSAPNPFLGPQPKTENLHPTSPIQPRSKPLVQTPTIEYANNANTNPFRQAAGFRSTEQTLKSAPLYSNSFSFSKDPKEVKEQVQEVVGIMQTNIDSVIERGEQLSVIQTRTGKISFFITKIDR